jgi:hypothetical protein
MSEDRELYLSEEAMFALVSTLATEVIRFGEDEAKLVESRRLTDEQSLIIMKANTLLTTFAMLLVRIIESEDPEFAKMVVEVWTTPAMQDMVRVAFAEEIEEAALIVAQGIDDLEKSINKETPNDSPSEQSD